MNTSDIRRALQSDAFAQNYLVDVFSYDQVVRNISDRDNKFYVFNTKPQLLPGEHWMAIGVRDGQAQYFDSFGRHPDRYPSLSARLKQLFSSVQWNKTPFQNPSTTACGDYCVLFGLFFARGKNLQDYVDWLSITKDSETRDHTVRQLMTSIYGDNIYSSYKNNTSVLSGVQQLHIDRVVKSVSGKCLFES